MNISVGEKNSRFSKDYLLVLIAILLLLANYIFAGDFIRKPISYIGRPFVTSGVAVGNAIDNSVEAFFSIPYIRAENAALQLQSAQLEADNRKFHLILEENIALQKELGLGSREDELVQANVLASDLGVDDSLIIDVGKRDGVEIGDVVRIGNIYIGYIISVEELTAKVALPNNNTSSVEVLLVQDGRFDQNIDELKASYSNRDDFARGVVVGSKSAIRVENISRNDSVAEGYAVVVNDSKVLDLLYIGSISQVVDDPSAPSKQAIVRPALIYNNINYLFVVID